MTQHTPVFPVLLLKAAPQEFSVGQRVERRDGDKDWSIGFVTSVNPLKVTASSDDPNETGYHWDEVRTSTVKFTGEEFQFAVGQKVEHRDGGKAWSVGFVTSLAPLKVTRVHVCGGGGERERVS